MYGIDKMFQSVAKYSAYKADKQKTYNKKYVELTKTG